MYRKKPEKPFNGEYEKILLACVLSNGRILGSICHDHPLHPNAIEYAEDGKSYYKVHTNNMIKILNNHYKNLSLTFAHLLFWVLKFLVFFGIPG